HPDGPELFSQIIESHGGPERFAQNIFNEIHSASGVDAWRTARHLESMGGASSKAATALANLQAKYDGEHPLEASAWAAGRFGWGAGEFGWDTADSLIGLAGDVLVGTPAYAARKLGYDVPEDLPDVSNRIIPIAEAVNQATDYVGDV
ncbi:hypothetical protein KU644_23885, partial [Salmonella enterica subsp. enterica serovar Kentucky]|nr:hypothetical protein [Salmonella enterica subsp. enterica serovar Kentucky]